MKNFSPKIREPAVAGQFYPESKRELEEMIDKFLSNATSSKIEGEVFGLLLPHAGYIFSGGVVAYGMKVLENKEFDTVILIGDSHYERFDGVSIWNSGKWKTPLGEVEVDEELASKILSFSDRFFVKDSAHLFEHSLEVEIPFLQKTLKKFKILPIIFGSENEDWRILAEGLLKIFQEKKVLIIASSDLSHYPPYEKAKEVDVEVLKCLENPDPQILIQKISQLERKNIDGVETFMCAQDAVKTLLEVARRLGGKGVLLKYANSGDIPSPFGNKLSVVGYGAVAFYLPYHQPLTKKEKEELLKIAKISVEKFLKEGKIPQFQPSSQRLKRHQGAFVTLKKEGHLRGCIGHIGEDMPLYEVVSQMAVAAAFYDSRFPPVREQDLPYLEYEISVLSPLKKIRSIDEIKLGVHGVEVVVDDKKAVFLPQVATENNWNLEEFLNHLMLKADLPINYWKENPVDFYIFEADVFSDKEIK